MVIKLDSERVLEAGFWRFSAISSSGMRGTK